MYVKLKKTIEELIQNFNTIPSKRKKLLREVAEYIKQELEDSEPVKLNFICTHNSRRSHLAQIWAQTAAEHYDINDVETYSGGTEATAFNPNAVAAIKRAGFEVENPGGDNPHYSIRFSDDADPMICFSKTFDDPVNPDKNFAAIMTCSDADENCPFVPGAKYRKPITYRDPKEADGTVHQEEVYEERCMQIGTEMFFLMSLAK